MAVDLRFTIGQASDELRYLVRRLRSPVIEEAGFVDALKGHLSLFAERSGISTPVEIEGTPIPLSPDVEQAAFRIVQEALTNVEKHGGARAAEVTLRFEPGILECAIEDDGVGFDPSEVPDEPDIEGGFGLLSMRQRAETLGGRLHITSSPGQGTKVAFDIPVGDQQTGEGT